jgi:hypothetical protein
MRRTQLTQEPNCGVVPEHAAGATTTAVCRRHGISKHTCSRWKPQNGWPDRRETTRRSRAARLQGRGKPGDFTCRDAQHRTDATAAPQFE